MMKYCYAFETVAGYVKVGGSDSNPVGRIKTPSGYLPQNILKDSLIGIWVRREKQKDLNLEQAAHAALQNIAKSRPKRELFEISRERVVEVLSKRLGLPNYDWKLKEKFLPKDDPEKLSKLYPGRRIKPTVSLNYPALSDVGLTDWIAMTGPIPGAFTEDDFSALFWIYLRHAAEKLKRLDGHDLELIAEAVDAVSFQLDFTVWGIQERGENGLIFNVGVVQNNDQKLLLNYRSFVALERLGSAFEESYHCQLNVYFFDHDGACVGTLSEFELWDMDDTLTEHKSFCKNPTFAHLAKGEVPTEEMKKLFNPPTGNDENYFEELYAYFDNIAEKNGYD